MESKDYRQILVRAYTSQELTPDDFDNTLIHFAKLYHKEKSKGLIEIKKVKNQFNKL